MDPSLGQPLRPSGTDQRPHVGSARGQKGKSLSRCSLEMLGDQTRVLIHTLSGSYFEAFAADAKQPIEGIDSRGHSPSFDTSHRRIRDFGASGQCALRETSALPGSGERGGGLHSSMLANC